MTLALLVTSATKRASFAPCLKKLQITSDVESTSFEDPDDGTIWQGEMMTGAVFHRGLLDIVEGLSTLEEFRLKDYCNRPETEFAPDWESWPHVLKEYPCVASKLVEIDGVAEQDVEAWAELNLKGVKSVLLTDRESVQDGFRRFQGIDAFPTLHKLVIEDVFNRSDRLLTWPLRDLKRIHLQPCEFGLQPEDYQQMRDLIGRRQLKVFVDLDGGYATDPEEISRLRAAEEEELAFWKTVVPAASIFYSITTVTIIREGGEPEE